MNGREQADFVTLRREMREGFDRVGADLNRVAERIDSLEATRDREAGAREIIAKAADRAMTRSMWRVGLIVSVLTSIAVTAASLVTYIIGLAN